MIIVVALDRRRNNAVDDRYYSKQEAADQPAVFLPTLSTAGMLSDLLPSTLPHVANAEESELILLEATTAQLSTLTWNGSGARSTLLPVVLGQPACQRLMARPWDRGT